MAGAKGRSGGARKNAGGARPGAGRPRKNPPPAAPAAAPEVPAEAPPERKEPLDFLMDVINDPKAPLSARVRAAVAAAQYKHTKTHDGGKKDAKADAAKKAAGGRFKPAAPPKLVVNNK